MRRGMKKACAFLAAAVLCAGMAAATAPIQVSAAEAPASGEAVSVSTTQRCSIWSAPATADENRVKYVDEGYRIQVYPEVIESELGDGKTFYRTIKGAYVLCRCVAAEGGAAETGNNVLPDDGGVLVPVGDFPRLPDLSVGCFVEGFYGGMEWYANVEVWYSYPEEYDDGVGFFELLDDGIYNVEKGIALRDGKTWETPVTDGYGITYRGCNLQKAMEVVSNAALQDPEIAQFLQRNGNRILLCSGDRIYADLPWVRGVSQGPLSWSYSAVECQRGECVCIVTDFGASAEDICDEYELLYELDERYGLDETNRVGLANEIFHSLMDHAYWQNVLNE